MIIPAKYQWSNENDPDNSLRINNITKKYITCLKKFGTSYNNKSKSNQENQPYFFQKKVLDWFFKLSFIDRVKVSCINNKWVFQILHQLYIEQKKNANLKFIPRFVGKNVSFIEKIKGKDFFSNKPSDFLNYFAFLSEKYELINGYNEKIEEQFLNEIIFLYPNLSKTSKIKGKDKEGNDGNYKNDENLKYLLKYHYPNFTLSESVLTNKEKFENYFKSLSNNNFFVMPPEVISPSKQKEINNNLEIDNDIKNSFSSLNPLNNFISNNSNINNSNSFNENNSNINNNYNMKYPNMIDLPMWAKQPADSKLCFSMNEIFLAFFEQNISVYYILFLYDKQFYDSLLNDNVNKTLEEFINLKQELKDFLCLNKENLLNIINIDTITKEIYYNPYIEKFVDIKKYKNNLVSRTKCWKENNSFEKVYSNIKEFFNGYNNDDDSMIRLINDLTFLNIEQIYTFEDFFLNKILVNLNKKYEYNKEEELILSFNSITSKSSKKKKKRNKKKKKNLEKDDNNINEDKKDDNKIGGNADTNNNNNKNDNNKNIEIKKFINIEEDEDLRKIKKGYAKLENNDSNLCESSGSENNACDAKPLLPSEDYEQIMKEKEKKYKIENEKENSNDINDKDDNKENEENNNNKNQNINIINKINDNVEVEKKQENTEDKKIEEYIENNFEVKKNSEINENKIIKEEDNNNNNKINTNNLNSNTKKKKGNNIFLYPTIKKISNGKVNKHPFIMKLNQDILSYNKLLLSALDSLAPIKEHIIETIKSHVQLCFLNENYFYQLEIYGSFKSHLDIVCSDIDMVFIPPITTNLDICDLILKLSNHFSSSNKYYKVTPIYTASIPLIKLVINYDNYLKEHKSLLDNYSKLKNSSMYQNYPYDKEIELKYINIDISFPGNYNNKENKTPPLQQIEFINNSLAKFAEANIVIRILKRALKLTDMNNSYKGGLSSYTVFLLVIAYMKHNNKNNNINNYKHKNSNSYGHAFHNVIKFFSKYDFLNNYIDVRNNNGDVFLKRDKNYNSHEYENIPIIIDPVTELNAGKSTFRIKEVQYVFILLNEELEKLRNIYDKNNNNENNKDKESENENLIITLLKNVEEKYLNK